MPKALRLLIRIITSLLGLAIVLGIAAVIILFHFNSPGDFSYDKALSVDGVTVETSENNDIIVRFEVRRGESAQSVGQRLTDASLIRNDYLWFFLFRDNMFSRLIKNFMSIENSEQLKTGIYHIEIPVTQMEIYKILISGKQIEIKVTVPEGFTLKKTARLLEEAGICSAEDFLAAAFDPQIISQYRIPGSSMEGYLFPDTYSFPADYPAAMIVQKMADNFMRRIGEIDESLKIMAPKELNDLVILASIVEREYMVAEEAPIMAGVFKNRLNIGMALQSCATVEYVITEIQGRPHPEILLTRDTEIADPYNTYIRPGLPPGPISAPGAVSLRAALQPEKNDYLYFRLLDIETRQHYFSRTLDEHIRAGTLYLKRN